MRIIQSPVTLAELRQIAAHGFGNMVKAVVDVEKKIMAIDAELHADEEAYLLEQGSLQADLWGINLYPDEQEENFIEFDSMINLRPSQDNRSRSVQDPALQKKIVAIVTQLVTK
ncbi:MAG: hypothetical protein G01um101431_1051 [Parcubacteria group bacterium Gr01-1014_31]|nr:MAG: hypothetical protein G01um101431_1051 [Parcubacteria group bacterium Gr01-1014_31]